MGRKKREPKEDILYLPPLPFFQGHNYLELPELHTFDSDSYIFAFLLGLSGFFATH